MTFRAWHVSASASVFIVRLPIFLIQPVPFGVADVFIVHAEDVGDRLAQVIHLVVRWVALGTLDLEVQRKISGHSSSSRPISSLYFVTSES
jgi:hypothetical protein